MNIECSEILKKNTTLLEKLYKNVDELKKLEHKDHKNMIKKLNKINWRNK